MEDDALAGIRFNLWISKNFVLSGLDKADFLFDLL
jgi:hypothetical protein